MTIDGTVKGSQIHGILTRHGSRLAVHPDRQTEVGGCGVHDRTRVSLRKNETIGGWMVRFVRIVAHVSVHEHRHEVRQAGGRSYMTTPGFGRHLGREFDQVDGFGMNGVSYGHVISPSSGWRFRSRGLTLPSLGGQHRAIQGAINVPRQRKNETNGPSRGLLVGFVTVLFLALSAESHQTQDSQNGAHQRTGKSPDLAGLKQVPFQGQTTDE